MQGASLIWWCPHWSISWGQVVPKLTYLPAHPVTKMSSNRFMYHKKTATLLAMVTAAYPLLTHYHVRLDSELCFITFPYNFLGFHFTQLLPHCGSSCSTMDSALNVASIVDSANRCTVQLQVVWLHTIFRVDL